MPRSKKSNRQDGRYQIIRVIGHTINGKPIKKSFYGSSKDEALLKYQEHLNGIQKGEALKKQTPFSFWVNKWLYTYKEPDVKATTFITTYERPCRNYIIPHFEKMFIQDITQIDIKEFINEVSYRSQSLLDKIMICLHGIFESAIDNDLIAKNPCRNIMAKSKAEREKKRTYDKETVKVLCASEHKYALYVHILLKMGLRCSELCGLRWEDIDLDRGILHVRQALTSENGQTFIDKPKTANSIRKLEIPKDLLTRLKAQKGTGYIAMQEGRHITPNHFGDRQLESYYNAIGVPKEQRLSPHELRHTCGTLLYKKTKDIYFVSRFLGHSDIGITTKTYVHSEMQDNEIHVVFPSL